MAKILIGTIVSLAMNNTAVVKVERSFPHPLYKKIIKRHKKFKAHHNNADLKIAMVVEIEECRPISKDKHFKIKKIIEEQH